MGYSKKSRRRPLWCTGRFPWFLSLYLSIFLHTTVAIILDFVLHPLALLQIPLNHALLLMLTYPCLWSFLGNDRGALGASVGWVNKSQDGGHHDTIETLQHMGKRGRALITSPCLSTSLFLPSCQHSWVTSCWNGLD